MTDLKLQAMRIANQPVPDDHARAQAKANPGGWVYAIGGGYDPDDAIPPQAIKGAWKVDASGTITGDFIPNPRFDPSHQARGKSRIHGLFRAARDACAGAEP